MDGLLYTISAAGIVKLLAIVEFERQRGRMPTAICDDEIANPTRASRFLRNEHNVSQLCTDGLL